MKDLRGPFSAQLWIKLSFVHLYLSDLEVPAWLLSSLKERGIA